MIQQQPNDLTDHFFWSEVVASPTADRLKIVNTLPEALKLAVQKTAMGMEKVRSLLGEVPININSWYRCPELNTVLGSKPTSQHVKGEAVDFTCPAFGSPTEIAKTIVANLWLIRYDQIILEHTWIHISWSSDPTVKQRGQVLSLLSTGGYAAGLTDKNGVPL